MAQIRVALRFFEEGEARIVEAATARIFPRDSAGPGAAEARVVIYIDRQLAGPYGRDRYRYTQGPFEDGTPEQGYQGKATPREIYRDGLRRLGKDFASLTATQQDARLRDMETTYFFRTLRQHTIEGMFSDPMHGGNTDMIGWKMIGYPGPYMSWSEHVDQHYGKPFRPKPRNLREVTGRAVKPSEDAE